MERSWQSGAKEYTTNVMSYNTPHARDLMGGKPRRLTASAQVKSSGDLSRRQGLYGISKRGECSLIEISCVGIGGMSSPELGHLTLM